MAATASGVSRTERSAALLFGDLNDGLAFQHHERWLNREPSRVKIKVLPSQPEEFPAS